MKLFTIIALLLLLAPTTLAQTPIRANNQVVKAQVGTSYTIINGDAGKLLTFSNGSAVAVSIAQAGVGGFAAGWFVDVKNLGAGTVTITPAVSTIGGASTLALTTNQSARVISNAINYLVTMATGTGGGGSGTVTSVSVVTANGLSGSVATSTTTPAITLDISGLNATKIADGTVTSSEFQFINSLTSNAQTQIDSKQPLDSDLTTIAGLTPTTNNFMAASGSAWASLTPTQATALLNAMVGDSGSGGTKGLVPAPAAGDIAKCLSGAGTYVACSGGSGSPGGSTTQVQYNNAGAFGGISGLTTNGSTTLVQTSNSATAFSSGPNGATNPVFQLVNNTASQATGVQITGGTAASGAVVVAAISSGAADLYLRPTNGTGIRASNNASGYSQISGDSATMFVGSNSTLMLFTSGVSWLTDNAGKFRAVSGGMYGFSSAASDASSAGTDANVSREAAGVIQAGTTTNNNSGIFDAAGYRIANAATTGNVLRGNGTNFVSATLAISDLSTFSSATLRTALTDENGTGVALFDAATSPSITTSLTTASTTFALLNTTATTVNAFGATTALNLGASATMILNFGGSTTASEFRFLEPSGSGTNYSAFKAVAQGANITYSLPPTVGGAGTFLTDAAGNGVLTWGTPAGSGTVNSGATNVIPKYTAATTIDDSLLSDDGTTLTYAGTGGVATGVGSGNAGTIVLGEGTAPSAAAANTLQLHAPADITTAYDIILPAASATGFMLGTDASNVNTITYVGFSGTGNVARVTSPTFTTPALGAATATSINIGSGTTIVKHLSATATLDFANLAAIGCEDLTITVTGAAVGDTVAIGVPNGSVVTNGNFFGWVSATNTVSIKFCTVVSGDPASGTFRADVWAH